MKYNLSPDHWRIAVHESKIILSISCLKDLETRTLNYKAIISNAFNVTKLNFGFTNIVPLDQPEGY